MESDEIEIFKIFKDTRIYRNDGKLWNGALWEVSNYGNVRKNGEDYILYENNGGYLGFGRNYLVHRAVGELFIPNPEPDKKTTIDHLNRIRTDNRASNLRWATPKEQAANRDNEPIINAVRKANLGNKYLLGHKNVLGRVWVFNPTTQQSNIIDPSQLPDFLAKGFIRGRKPSLGRRLSEETKAKISAAHLGRRLSEETKAKISAVALGYKHTLGKVWVVNPTTENSTMVNPSELNDYFAKGYIRGRKIKT